MVNLNLDDVFKFTLIFLDVTPYVMIHGLCFIFLYIGTCINLHTKWKIFEILRSIIIVYDGKCLLYEYNFLFPMVTILYILLQNLNLSIRMCSPNPCPLIASYSTLLKWKMTTWKYDCWCIYQIFALQ